LGVAWERRLVSHHIDACRDTASIAKPMLTLVHSADTDPACPADRKVA
jgi:hypothetical protein